MSKRERRVEDIFVVVGRAVEQADALPGLHGDIADLGVDQGGALEAVHRGGPADDLVDRGLRAFALEKLPLVRVFEECVHAVRHGVAGGLVAGHGQQDHEERELHVRDAAAFILHVGLHESGHDVVGRTLTALLGHVVGVAHQLGVGHRRIGVEIRIVGVHDGVGPVEELLPVFLGHADQVRDGQQRQAHRDVVDEIAAVLLGRRGHDVAGRARPASPPALPPTAV